MTPVPPKAKITILDNTDINMMLCKIDEAGVIG